MNPLHVLVCGTNYGRMYVNAIRLGGPPYHLVGIFGRGSTRSKQLARDCGVPLYRSVEELPAGIDLACAAMGASGAGVVLDLLSRGINVLCEHPQRLNTVRSALGIAASHRVCFHVNGHFADLEPSAAFIAECRRRNKSMPASFYHITATDRSLYAVLDILHRILASFSPFEFHVRSRCEPFVIIQGAICGVPVTFHLQSGNMQCDLADGSPAYLVDHRIAAGFTSGLLTLLSVDGPVVWNVNLNSDVNTTEPLFAVIHGDHPMTPEVLNKQRDTANLSAISALANDMHGSVKRPEQASDYLVDVSSAWETLGALLQE